MIIHTLETRDYFGLDVMKDHFNLSYIDIHNIIRNQYEEMIKELNDKGINYNSLKNMLTPQKSTREICLVFDTNQINESWYGKEVFNKYFPLVKDYNNFCVFEGDFIGNNKNQQILFNELSKNLIIVNETIYQNSNQYYLIYINNLSTKKIINIINGLAFYKPFCGYLDFTYSSILKTYISRFIGQRYFILNKHMVQSSSDPENDSIPSISYDITQYNYNSIVISDMNYRLFLTYKIEREYYNTDISDQLNSLASISTEAKLLQGFKIIIEDKKYNYLINEKRGGLKATIFGYIDKEEIEKIIQNKINNNYIFNLNFSEEYNVLKFNTIIEINRIDKPEVYRYLVALEYKPKNNELRLITMY
jgi:hypothetical protein